MNETTVARRIAFNVAVPIYCLVSRIILTAGRALDRLVEVSVYFRKIMCLGLGEMINCILLLLLVFWGIVNNVVVSLASVVQIVVGKDGAWNTVLFH